MKFFFSILSLSSALFLLSCNNTQTTSSESANKDTTAAGSKIKTESINYNSDSKTMDGYVAYNDSMQGKRPAILIVHEWWGLNDYVKDVHDNWPI